MTSIKDWMPGEAIQKVSRIGRKVHPVTYIDLESRSYLSIDPGPGGDVICGAYKVGDGPVHLLPWEAACARRDWPAADRLRPQGIPLDSRGMVDMGKVTAQWEARREHNMLMSDIRAEQIIQYNRDMMWLDRPWLIRKFLTLAARARTIFSR